MDQNGLAAPVRPSPLPIEPMAPKRSTGEEGQGLWRVKSWWLAIGLIPSHPLRVPGEEVGVRGGR